MARIRTVKPEFWQNESLAMLPAQTRLLAIGLLNVADDEGYFKASPALVKAAIFPFEDSMNILGMLQELSSVGYLRLGECSEGKKYGFVVNFLKHQRVDKPKQSEIKGLCKFEEHSKIIPRLIQDVSLQERKGKEVEMERKEGGDKSPSTSPGKGSPLMTLSTYVTERKKQGQKAIPDNHAVHDYAEQAGIPDEFLHLAWHEFKQRYLTPPDHMKRYRDWGAVFLKAVKGNWMKVWYIDGDQYKLTTVGLQAERARKNHAA